MSHLSTGKHLKMIQIPYLHIYYGRENYLVIHILVAIQTKNA